MGGAARAKPQRLAEKLQQIRKVLDLTQDEMVARLGVKETLARSNITRFEQGQREPSLLILFAYARLVNISTDALIDDDLDLPPVLPSPTQHAGIPRKPKRASHKPI